MLLLISSHNTNNDFSADRIWMSTESKTVEWEAMTEPAMLSWRRRDGKPRHVELWTCRQGANVFVAAANVQVQKWEPSQLLQGRRGQHRTCKAVTFCTLRCWALFLYIRFGYIGSFRFNRSHRLWSAAIGIRRRGWFWNHLQGWIRWHGRPGHIFRFVYIRNETTNMNVFFITVSRFGQFGHTEHIATVHIIIGTPRTRPVIDLRATWLNGVGNSDCLAWSR